MGLFNRKPKNKEPETNPHQIQIDFYNDWFKSKYNTLFESPYLLGIKSVIELDLESDKKENIKMLTPETVEECLDATNIKFKTVAYIEAGFIVLGHLILKYPQFMLDSDFESFYHQALPHQIEALHILTKYGQEHDYPEMRITAALSKMKYVPNFTIQATEIAAQHNVDIIDLKFYDRFEKVRNDLYLNIIELVDRLYKEALELESGSELDMVDHLLDLAMKPLQPVEEIEKEA